MNFAAALLLLLLFGFAGRAVAHRAGLPAISGYLVAGLLLGPSVSGAISEETVGDLSSYVTPLSLAVIAYLIGGRLELRGLMVLRRQIAIIALAQALACWVLTVLVVTALGPLILPESAFGLEDFLAMGILAGAISLATAPATTLAVVEESHSQGPLTATLLAIVAIDDALAALAYSIAIVLAAGILDGTATTGAGQTILVEMGRVGLSVLLGAILALVMLPAGSRLGSRWLQAIFILAIIALATGFVETFELFVVMTSMVFGFVAVNRQTPSTDLIGPVHQVEGAVFILFFTLAGTHLELGVLDEAGPLAALIILGRSAGKFSGAIGGASLANAPDVVKRYLPFLLLPKAGITLGLALQLQEKPELAVIAGVLVPAVLASTLINELIAPPLSRWALSRSGEAVRSE